MFFTLQTIENKEAGFCLLCVFYPCFLTTALSKFQVPMFLLLLYYTQGTDCAVKTKELLRDFQSYNVVKRGPKIRN